MTIRRPNKDFIAAVAETCGLTDVPVAEVEDMTLGELVEARRVYRAVRRARVTTDAQVSP